MKFGQFRDRVPEIGEKVHLKPTSGKWFPSSIHELMKSLGFEQVERRNEFVWRTKYQIPKRSWDNLRGQLVDQGGVQVEKVE